MNKRFAILIFLMVWALAACGTAPDPSAGQSGSGPQVAPPPAAGQAGGQGETSEEAAPEPQPVATKATITVYYSDPQLLELGAEEREIAYTDPVDKYKQALALLEKPVKAEHIPLWQDFQYHSLTFADGQLTIDSKGSNVYNLGASGEALALDALRQTLYQFPEVQKIVILEDGQPVDSLMGHVTLEEALAR